MDLVAPAGRRWRRGTGNAWGGQRLGAEPCHVVKDHLQVVAYVVKWYRGEDAKDKQEAMETRSVPGMNRLDIYGRWNLMEPRI